ncbi:MAG: thioredoxin [Geitlerinemataceae cyanobacterium]
MGYSIDVCDHNFEEEVLEKSHQIPVIVDFFATWCGPCQMLKPILENIAQEYDCVVAKVDIDENQYLATTYQIEGVPDVKVFRDGKVVDGFVGVLPEPQLKEFLANCQIISSIDKDLAAVKSAMSSKDWQSAKTSLNDLLDRYPGNRRLALAAAKCSIVMDCLDRALELVSDIREDEKPYYSQAQAVKSLIEFKQKGSQPLNEDDRSATPEEYLDRKYSHACFLTVEEKYEQALTGFLEIVAEDRKYRDDGARKAMLAIFELLGNEHPLTNEYRKKLLLVLY